MEVAPHLDGSETRQRDGPGGPFSRELVQSLVCLAIAIVGQPYRSDQQHALTFQLARQEYQQSHGRVAGFVEIVEQQHQWTLARSLCQQAGDGVERTPPINTASGALNSPDSMPGATIYNLAGCVNCHTRVTFTTPAAPANGAPGSFRFRPYSDFLVHDMGTLEDLIGNDFDSVATTRKMRTAPLWGLRLRKTTLLHDGSANNVSDAITRHDGQGLDSANRFRLLPPAQKTDLINYLMVL